MSDKNSEGEIKFFADCMLGRLARWMRALGFDTSYERSIEDDELLVRCRAESRVLLSRDNQLIARCNDVDALLVDSEKAEEQLRQVMSHFQLAYRKDNLFTRCTHCNSRVIEVPKEEVKGRIPPFVFSTEQRFTYCRNCDKLFWRGTHRYRFLDHVFEEKRD